MVFSVDVWVQKGDVGTWCRLEQDLHGPRILASPGAADLRPLPGETDTAVVNVDVSVFMVPVHFLPERGILEVAPSVGNSQAIRDKP